MPKWRRSSRRSTTSRPTPIATPRFRATLVGTFAGLALLLAMAGVYGLLTYLTAQRMPELGVRMALGAGPGSVMSLVLGRAAVIGGVGLAIGLVLSLLSSRLLTTMVFGLSAVDWTTYAVVGSAVLIVTLLAAFVPAWRASRIDPLTVLRRVVGPNLSSARHHVAQLKLRPTYVLIAAYGIIAPACSAHRPSRPLSSCWRSPSASTTSTARTCRSRRRC